MATRDESLRIRLSELEKKMLQELADAEGLNTSEYIRLVVRREHSERFGPPVAKTKKR